MKHDLRLATVPGRTAGRPDLLPGWTRANGAMHLPGADGGTCTLTFVHPAPAWAPRLSRWMVMGSTCSGADLGPG